MGSDERLRLAQRRAQARFLWFDKQPVPETGFASLDEELWRPLVSAQGAAAPDLALAKLGLLTDTEDGPRQATVAGILLCSRERRVRIVDVSGRSALVEYRFGLP